MVNLEVAKNHYVIFDLETTGLSSSEDQIIEIAAQKITSSGEEVERFHRFVKLYKKDSLDPFIVNLTSITEGLLEQKGEDVTDVMDDFFEFSDDCVLVAQNAKFDIGFLVNYYLTTKKSVYGPVYLDTINLAKTIYPEQKSYKLAVLTEMFDVEYSQDSHHRADYDVEITTAVFVKQLQMLNSTYIYELINHDGQRKMSEKQNDFLTSLCNQNNIQRPEDIHLNVTSASMHIDYLLKNK